MLVYILLKIMRVFSSYCGEDEYQKSRQTDTLPYIYAELKTTTPIENFKDKINRVYEEYFPQKDLTFQDSTYFGTDEFLKKRSFEAYIHENTYKIYFDHRYFSGLFFLLLGKHLFNVTPLNVMKEIYIPFVSEFFIVKFLFFMYFFSTKNNDIKFIDNKEDMRRENVVFTIEASNVKRKYAVLFKVLSHIRNTLKLRRPLKVLIPVAFEASEGRYNNVGAIFCYFDGSMDSMIKQIEANKYQANASNLIQRFVNSGKKARNSVDVVLSCGCLSEEVPQLESLYVTYENIADYPVYCLLVTFGNQVRGTITWMCKTID